MRVFVFLSTECPISNGYLVTLSGLQAKISESKSAVDFLGVVYDPTVARTAAAEHFAEYKAGFPILWDPSGMLVQVLKPSRVPEAFVLDGNGQLVYRGAIDNTWEALGRRRPKADKHFLADAIAAAVEGKPVKIAETKPVGCLIEMPPKDDKATGR